jgi:5'-nucleotidase
MLRIGIFICSFLLALLATQVVLPQPSTVTIKLIAINDFHGNLETANLAVTMPNGERLPAGGAEYLATHIAKLKAQNPNSLIVSAGDSVGATPLLSALFHDEPAIEALNMMRLDLNAVGNHEFDRGTKELMRLQKGGCHPQDGCQGKEKYEGAKFQYLGANVIDRTTNKTILPAYQVRSLGGVKIGFIGLTLEGTPRLVSPSGVAGLEFKDEAETINALVPELTKQGVKAIVVLIHEGGLTKSGINECPALSGAIVDIVKGTDRAVDLFITGHTHQAYNCLVDGRRVTSAASFGRLLTDIDLQIERRGGEVKSIRAQNIVVSRDVPKSPPLTALINQYKAIADPLANRVIGKITTDILRQSSPAGEMPLGNLIADAQLSATQSPANGGAEIALMNPGGIRAELSYTQTGKEGDGNVTYGEAFAVQPFGNNLVTITLTGAQIKKLLEQQFDNPIKGQNRILQVSRSLKYQWNSNAEGGDRVRNITVNGQSLVLDRDYRVTVNSFLADGGDNFTVLTEGRNRLGGVTDLAALESYFKERSPISAPVLDRIGN